AHPQPIALSIESSSLHPLLYGEVLVNGRPEVLLNAQNIQAALPGQSSASTAQVVYRTKLNATVTPKRSGWLAVRCYQRHPDGQVRFAHTAPWYVEVDQQPVLPTRQEKAYLVERMQAEIQRSGDIVSEPARAEYQRGLEFYERLSTYDDSAEVTRNARPARSPDELAKWQTIFAEHRLTIDEMHHATGLPLDTLQKTPSSEQSTGTGLRLYPYPGGRHPRRGFLDGAIDPQRESKISIFPPWDKHGDSGYVVVDVPEAIFSNLGLIYLAHSHVPTIWDKENRQLEKLEWQMNDQALTIERRLPNGITFESTVRQTAVGATMRIVLSNGTREKLTGLRVQVCMMLGSLIGFNDQEPLESIVQPPYVAVRGSESSRWLVTHWTPNQRVWQNAPVPCIHSDPIFPDCAPGQSVEVSGEVQFYEGDQVRSVMK
ncbi:MAG: hypothetical protein IT423_11940, partial [Pirellulaceae bacterium]|nr:hypothetical protein [Pirellulaceae bacterium]